MAVPISGQFLMFGHTDNTTISGAIIEGGANSATIQNTTDFNTLITLSDINLFDPNFSEGATILTQISKMSQYRGYPIMSFVNQFLLRFGETCENVCELPVNNLSWETTVNNNCNPDPWVISSNQLQIRYNIEDSLDCGGTCGDIQSGTANATITVGNLNTFLILDFQGIGELEESNFEKISFFLNGSEIARGNAAGGGLGCEMGPIIKTVLIEGPYLLEANTQNEFLITFTTEDQLYHVDAFYQINLSFDTPSINNSYYSDCLNLEIGCNLYQDTEMIILVPDGFYSDLNNCYHIISGEIITKSNCAESVCTPFTGSAIIIENPQETVVTAIRLQSSGTDCSNGNSTDPFVTYAYIVADYPDLVLNNNILVLNNTTGLGFGGIETQLYNPNDNDVSISNNSISSDLANFISGSFNETFLINQASLSNTNSPNIFSSTNSSGTIQFELCVSDPNSGDSGTE